MLGGVTTIPSPILLLPVPLSPRGKRFFINFLYIILCNANQHENIFLYPSDIYIMYNRVVKVKLAQLCPVLCNPMDYTVLGIL